MAKEPVKMVRYQVLQTCFVNGSMIDPKGAANVFVTAPAGLESAALKLATDVPVATPSAASPLGGSAPDAALPQALAEIKRLQDLLAAEVAAHDATVTKFATAQAEAERKISDAAALFEASDADAKKAQADRDAAYAQIAELTTRQGTIEAKSADTTAAAKPKAGK